MKKVLLPFIAACACAAPAFADEVYGTTPETAKPFPAAGGWFVPDLATAPAEAWFTITNTQEAPVLWGGGPTVAPDVTDKQQVFVYLCNGGQEAFQMVEGDDSYVLLPNQEYLIKITPKAAGSFASSPAMALPERMKGTAKYYPIDRSSSDYESPNYKGIANSQTANTTQWYLYDFSYPTSLNFTTPLSIPVMDITATEAIHIQCPGGTNYASGILPTYVKAGKSIIGVTVSADVNFIVTANAFSILSCNNNLLRDTQPLKLDVAQTYPDAYYTVEKTFTVPEDGTYTFTNHGAKGTILNVGNVNVIDAATYKYECDWSNIKSATVGNEDAVIVVENLKAGEVVLVQSDAFGVIGEGVDNLPYLKVTKGGDSAIDNITADADGLKVNVAGSNLNVESVLLASGAEVAVYDMLARKVASAVAPAGAASLDMNLDVAPGVYVVVVYGKGNSESAKIAVK